MGHEPGSPEFRRVMVAMFAAGLATFVLLYDTQALLPDLRDTFGVSPSAATLTVSMATAALAVTLLVVGPASERFGRTPVIITSVWAASVIALLCPLAPTWEVLLGLRLLQGISLAGVPAVATAYLREELHQSAQARAAGLYIGGTAIGGMTGRLVTAGVTELSDWRWGMGAAGVVALVCAVVVTIGLPRSRNFRRHEHLDVGAMSRAALADRGLRWLYVVGAVGMGMLVSVFNTLGFRLTAPPFGLGLAAISLLYLTWVLGSISSTWSGLAADRWGRRTVLPFGAALAAIGVVLTLFPWPPVIILGLATLVVGFFVMHGLASGWVAVRAHRVGASASQAASIYLCAYYAGSSVFGTLGGTVWSRAGWPGVVALALGLVGVAVVATIGLRRTPIPPAALDEVPSDVSPTTR